MMMLHSNRLRTGGRVGGTHIGLWLSCCGLALLCIAGCEPASRSDSASSMPSAGGGEAPGQPGPDRVTLMLNWYPEAEHGGFFAAKVHGIFARHGLDVDIRPGGENAPVAQELITGRVQFAIGNADDVLLWRQQGGDIVALMAPIQQTPRCIMVRADSGIDSLSQLEGLTLQANRGQAFLSFMEARGMLEGVQVVPYSGSVARFVADDKTAIQAYNFSEPQLAEQQGVPAKVLMLSEIGFNPYASCLLAHSPYVKEHPAIAERMVLACREGWQKYLESPDETNAAILAINPERMTAEALSYGAQQLKPLCTPAPEETQELGGMSLQRWQTLVDQFIELKLVTPDKVKASETFVDVSKNSK